MQNNPEIEYLIEQAVKIARDKKHEYVLTEHLLLSLIQYAPFQKTLDKYGVEVEAMTQELDAYLNSLVSLVKDQEDLQPKKTSALERIFNRANVQVMFTGRRSMTTIDLYLSIMSENNSHAHYFLLKYGVKKAEFVDFWQKHYNHNDVKMTDQQATDVLTEYCTSLTAAAKENRLEPLIGRETELHEMITVMARRFKANVLMVGDPGVGKTAIAEGLARRIVDHEVPEVLVSDATRRATTAMVAIDQHHGDQEEACRCLEQEHEPAEFEWGPEIVAGPRDELERGVVEQELGDRPHQQFLGQRLGQEGTDQA